MKKVTRWIFYSITALVTLVVVVPLAILITVFALVWFKLPDLDVLTDYQPRVKIENVPNTLKQALLAAEDERFYEHMGIDFVGWLDALRGDRSAGGSTITMQVARNFFLTRNRPTGGRHLYQILLPLKIERNFSKDQILEFYINRIFLGQRAYGFEAAAQTYFGKTLGELSLAETAMLAGLPRGPSVLNPIDNPTLAKRRQSTVLKRMRDVDFIDEAAYQAALEEPLRTGP